MERLKKISAALVFLSVTLLFISCRDSAFSVENIPPKLDFAKRIVVLLYEPENPEANNEGWLTHEISSAEKIQKLCELLTQNTSSDSGDCGYGDLRLVFINEEQSIMILPALDGCPTMYVAYEINNNDFYGEITNYYNEHYYSISLESKEQFNIFLLECFPTASQNWSWNRK